MPTTLLTAHDSPANNDENELYAEIVKGLGETLVGNYPGRALSFKADKRANSPPVITGFPSKNVALSVPKGTLIFRSDSNGEDLEGYAGAGLYESVTTEVETVTHVDYSKDEMVWNDRGTADQIMSKITEAGIAIEKALGCAKISKVASRMVKFTSFKRDRKCNNIKYSIHDLITKATLNPFKYEYYLFLLCIRVCVCVFYHVFHTLLTARCVLSKFCWRLSA